MITELDRDNENMILAQKPIGMCRLRGLYANLPVVDVEVTEPGLPMRFITDDDAADLPETSCSVLLLLRKNRIPKRLAIESRCRMELTINQDNGQLLMSADVLIDGVTCHIGTDGRPYAAKLSMRAIFRNSTKPCMKMMVS